MSDESKEETTSIELQPRREGPPRAPKGGADSPPRRGGPPHTIIPVAPEEEDGVVVHNGERYLYKPDEDFKSCCFKCDKPLCLHISKMFVSVSVLFFCMFMLQDKDNSAEFYTGTIAGLLGHYLNNSVSATKPGQAQRTQGG